MDVRFPDIANWPDIVDLVRQLDNAKCDAEELVSGLSEELGTWTPPSCAWSVAECLDHIAIANSAYLNAMFEPAERARRRGRMRRAPAKPGLFGAWFVRTLEPPIKPITRRKAPRSITPRPCLPLAKALRTYLSMHDDAHIILRASADLDLSSILFPNPFVRGVRFSLATGFNVIIAHERRHLWQAWRVRRAAEASPPAQPAR